MRSVKVTHVIICRTETTFGSYNEDTIGGIRTFEMNQRDNQDPFDILLAAEAGGSVEIIVQVEELPDDGTEVEEVEEIRIDELDE